MAFYHKIPFDYGINPRIRSDSKATKESSLRLSMIRSLKSRLRELIGRYQEKSSTMVKLAPWVFWGHKGYLKIENPNPTLEFL